MPRLVILLLVTTLYAGPVLNLFRNWWTDDAASYGLVALPLACYFAYAARRRVSAIPAEPDARGLLAILAAAGLLLAGTIAAELFLTRISLVVLLSGLAWTFWGLRRTRAVAFPLLLLATMVPLPAIVYNQVTLPLQLFSSEASTAMLQFFGKSVFREGNILELPHITLGVEEACSGLHSMASLMIAALVLGFMECSRVWARALLVMCAMLLAIAVNVVRVTGAALLAELNPDYAGGFFHAFSGWLIFLLGFGVMLALARTVFRTRHTSPNPGDNPRTSMRSTSARQRTVRPSSRRVTSQSI